MKPYKPDRCTHKTAAPAAPGDGLIRQGSGMRLRRLQDLPGGHGRAEGAIQGQLSCASAAVKLGT